MVETAAPHGYISRANGGLRNPKYQTPARGPVATFFLHHGASGGGQRDGDAEDESAIWRAYQTHHMDTKGWADVAYSAGLDFDARIHAGRGYGIAPGATRGYNLDNGGSLALCLIGNGDNKISKQMIEAAAWFSARAVALGHAKRDARWRPHSSVSSTHCPGNAMRAALPAIQELHEQLLGGIVLEGRKMTSPVGYLDVASGGRGSITVAGWAADADAADAALKVHIYANGGGVGVITAAVNRPDVGKAFPELGSRHGFARVIELPAGTYTIEAYALGLNDTRAPDGENQLLGSVKDVMVAAPPGVTPVPPPAVTPDPVRLTPLQIFEISVLAGFSPSEAVTMTAVALAESGGRVAALNDRGEYSQGLWQINAEYHKKHVPVGADPYDPGVNAFLAKTVYSRVGKGSISPWTVTHIDKNMPYTRYEAEATQAAVDAGYEGVVGWWAGAPGYGSDVSASADGVSSVGPAVLVPFGVPAVVPPVVAPSDGVAAGVTKGIDSVIRQLELLNVDVRSML